MLIEEIARCEQGGNGRCVDESPLVMQGPRPTMAAVGADDAVLWYRRVKSEQDHWSTEYFRNNFRSLKLPRATGRRRQGERGQGQQQQSQQQDGRDQVAEALHTAIAAGRVAASPFDPNSFGASEWRLPFTKRQRVEGQSKDEQDYDLERVERVYKQALEHVLYKKCVREYVLGGSRLAKLQAQRVQEQGPAVREVEP